MARLLFGIDRVLAIATSTVNGVGNSVAVLVLSKWENMYDGQKFDACLGGGAIPAEPRPAILPGDHA